MASEVRRHDTPPAPPPDEGYWAALLAEAETAMGGLPQQSGSNGKPTGPLDGELSTHEEKGGVSGTLADWEQVEQVYRTDSVVELNVVGYNRGGLLVEWGSLRGFVPASQLVDFPSDHESLVTRRNSLIGHLGRNLQLRVIELDRAQSRLILSERAAQVQAGAREAVLRRLKPGDVCQGQITNLCHFGAFVDLGGLEGLIHISELSWGRVGHPADILQRGQQVKVYVMEIAPEEGRVALSVKRLLPDPWETVEERYKVGQEVQGVITHVVDFGAFVCIEDGLEGLIHISELAEGHFLHPYNVVRQGQTVTARILHIDGSGRRLGLSLRR
jgi:small subunit ribosomal protein S1